MLILSRVLLFKNSFIQRNARKLKLLSILPLKGVEKFKGYKWYFRCEGTRPNVEVDISRSTTSSVCTIIPSGLSIVMTST